MSASQPHLILPQLCVKFWLNCVVLVAFLRKGKCYMCWKYQVNASPLYPSVLYVYRLPSLFIICVLMRLKVFRNVNQGIISVVLIASDAEFLACELLVGQSLFFWNYFRCMFVFCPFLTWGGPWHVSCHVSSLIRIYNGKGMGGLSKTAVLVWRLLCLWTLQRLITGSKIACYYHIW